MLLIASIVVVVIVVFVALAFRIARPRLLWIRAMLRDWPNLARYAAENAKLGPVAPGERRAIFMGDSITELWDLTQSFPGQPYVNRGISGQTTAQMLLRFRQDVIELQPVAVIIQGGANDMGEVLGPMTLQMTQNNLASMAELARLHSIAVVLAAMLPTRDPGGNKVTARCSPLKIRQLNLWIREYCEKTRLVYLDFYSPMADGSGLLRPGLSDDGLHPNAAGYAVMTPLMQNAIRSALESGE